MSGKTFGEPNEDEAVLSGPDVRRLLEELHKRTEDPKSEEASSDGSASLNDIAEATGHDIEVVRKVWKSLKHPKGGSNRSKVLRELEEPLFRVERPGHTQDPLLRHFAMREQVFGKIIEDEKNWNEEESDEEPAKVEKTTELWIRYAVTLLVLLVLISALVIVVEAVMKGL